MHNNIYELTNPQKSIWFTEEFYKGTPMENIAGSVIINEKVDFRLLTTAINLFVKNNDSFNLRFTQTKEGVKQYLDDFKSFTIDIIDVSSNKDVSNIEKELTMVPFNVLDSELYSAKLFKFPDNHGGFSICIHHLIGDAWTSGLIIDGIINIYSELLKDSSKIDFEFPSYLEYINSESNYLNSDKFNKDKSFWTELYKEVPELASIPTMNSVSKTSCDAKRKVFTLPKETFELINSFTKKYKASPFNFFMGIYALYLGRVSNLDEFVIGTPILNRSNFKDKHTTGMFISTVPFKVTINNETTFAEFVSKISSDFFDIFRHQKYPYQYLLEDLRKDNPSIPNLYDMALSYQNMRTNSSNSDINFSSSWATPDYIADSLDVHFFDLDNTGKINIAYDYQTAKYSIDDICSIHARILNIINQILNNEELLLKDIEIVTPDEKQKLLYEFNNTKMDYPKDKTITQLFEEQVEKTPDNIAVVFEDQKLTYKELNEKANSLANYLRDNGIQRNDIVGIHLEKSINYIISILGTLKLGCAFVPLSILHPVGRIEYILDNCNAKLLISNSTLSSKINYKCKYYDIENLASFNSKNLNISISSNTLAYILYTSGSTGNPKGVMIKNCSVINHVYGINQKFNNSINNTDNTLSVANMSFDANIQEIFIPLLLGATLHLLPDNSIYDIKFLANYIYNNKISFSFLPPNILDEIFELLKPFGNINLNKMLVGVESIKYSTLNKFLTLNKNMNIHNGYGPTEATICCISYMYNLKNKTDSSNILPIGTPLGNTKIVILNKMANTLQPIGIPGEICILGDCISTGYVDSSLNINSFTNCKYYNAPMYKTGDYGYLLPDGNIMFVGRLDNQVKINGHRIELQEINTLLQSFKNINKSITLVNDKHIFCYYTANLTVDTDNLKKYLSENLPYYMMPYKLLELGAFPITNNGKIDFQKLSSLSVHTSIDSIVLPQNEIEQDIYDLFLEILSINKLSIYDNFFDVGGDSLSAIRLSLTLSKKYTLDINAQDIFSNSSVEQLAKYISLNSISNKKFLKIPKINCKKYVLSSAQKRTYFASNMSGKDSILYNIPGGVILDKPLDINKLEKCINTIIDHQESLRTYFEIENDEVVQKIKDNIDFKLDIENETIDINNLNEVFNNFVKPFDLSIPPLLRAKIINLNNGKIALFIDMHHIISDGTSLSIFINELCSLYNGKSLQPLNITYKDFAGFEQSKLKNGDFKEAEDFWVNQFLDDIPVLNMPTNYARPAVKSYEGNKIHSVINKETTQKISNLSKELGVTPYMLLLSIYYVLLSKYSSQEDIVVGSPIVGRDMTDLYNIIGMFVNSLPIRAKVDFNLSFKDFVNNIKNICLNNYKYQDYPFDELVNKLNIQRDTSRNPLFDTMFIYQNNGNTPVNFDGIKSEYYIPDINISKFDLSLEVIPNNGELNLSFEYCTKLFDNYFIENLSNHYLNIITYVLDNIDVKLSNIDMLSKEEKNKILYEFNNTKMDYPKDKTITQLFEEQVEKTPNNIAVVFEDQKLTYKELNEKANSLANYLINQDICSGDCVPVLLTRSIDLIISMLAIIKIGAIYLPLSTEYPIDRLNYILSDSNAKNIITNSKINLILEDNISIINFDKLILENYNNKNLNKILSPLDVLYIIYTSGSTGNPKGVGVMHKNLNNFIHSFNNRFENISSDDRILASANICFDVSIFEFYIALLNGSSLYLYEENTINNIFKYCNSIINNNITMLYIAPNILEEVYQILEKNNYQNINKLLLGVEPIKSKVIKKYYNLNDNMKIINAYGPTEATICATYYTISKENIDNYKIIPIGKPLHNLHLFILDKNYNLVPAGVSGELYICGDNVTKGYIFNKDLTKKFFVNIPYSSCVAYKTGDMVKWDSDGNITFIGRNDSQIKINGHRIELGEIEGMIYSYPNINKCIVTVNKDNKLVAYFSSYSSINIPDLKTFLQTKLPLYFVPNFLVQVDKFKLTNNGKIDKKALEKIKLTITSNYEEAHNPEQKKLVSIFKSILNISHVGINDNFFELGGDSLVAIKLQIEAFNAGINISYKDIFDYPTIKQLSEKISVKSISAKIDNYDYSSINALLNTMDIGKIKKEKIRNVLLTGSTGFLGAHILDSLLKNTKCNIYCLIRAKKNTDPQTRLVDILHFYFGNKYDKYIFKRIFVVEGDISKKNLGIQNIYYSELGNEIDCVINSAALVKHYGMSALFNETNIDGTQNIIDFCLSFNCKLVHCSTLSVCGNIFETDKYTKASLTKGTIFQESNLYIGQDLSNIYIYTKFIAERLILENIINKNLDAKIIRLGNITNRYSDGMFQINISENAFLNRIKSFLQIGCVPDYIADGYAEFTPVDICSDAIVKLTFAKTTLTILHVYNNNHIEFNKLIELFNKFNINISVISKNDFDFLLNKSLKDDKLRNNLSGIINDFDTNKKLVYDNNIVIKNTITNKLLNKLIFKWPKIDAKYIKKYIVYLKSIGYLK